MTEQRVTFETAVLAKEKGFDEEVKNAFVNFKIDEDINTVENSSPEEFYYAKNHNIRENRISQPTQSFLQKWLREVHGIDILSQRTFSNGIKEYILTPCFDKPTTKGYNSVKEKNYEEALELALQEALKLIP